jgi:gamma-glutamyl:cysteine ligase YbdK (ATP-grasp superfamily)
VLELEHQFGTGTQFSIGVEGAFPGAAWFGVGGELIDLYGEHRPVSEMLDAVLTDVGGYADELGCDAEMAGLSTLLRNGGGAGRQRSVFEIADIGAVTRTLAEQTAAAAAAAGAG